MVSPVRARENVRVWPTWSTKAANGTATIWEKHTYPGSHEFFTGYFLFPTAGKYRVKLYAGTISLDSAVISTAETAR